METNSILEFLKYILIKFLSACKFVLNVSVRARLCVLVCVCVCVCAPVFVCLYVCVRAHVHNVRV
jgi:hypothetical protein